MGTRLLLALPLLIALAAPAAAAPQADLAELWRVGSLWEVGDNRQRVADARAAIIDSGEKGMAHAVSRLGATDGLEVRCLRAVFAGWGARGYPVLAANIANADVAARRNVADLLEQLDDPRAAQPLLAQAGVEENEGVRMAQLAALAKWRISDSVPLLVTASQTQTQRLRHRAASLLARFEDKRAAGRLIEMLDDEVYYVAAAAQDALKQSAPETRRECLSLLEAALSAQADDRAARRMRHLMPVVATLADKRTPELLVRALGHESGAVRGEAAEALVNWKNGAGMLDGATDVRGTLQTALKRETDPFARVMMRQAVERTSDTGNRE